MVFNSLQFLIFFGIFFILYWFIFNREVKYQNLLLLVGSYVFYGWWDWRFLFLLIGTSALAYYLGLAIGRSKSDRQRRWLLAVGLIQGIGGLIFFKYFNFFVDSFVHAFAAFKIHLSITTFKIILPLGISFYTFRTISYLLDVDKGKIKPVTDGVVFFSYISFFPGLISGPIDRAATLVPQLVTRRVFDYQLASDGMRQILWGLFKKIVVADSCANYFGGAMEHYQTMPASVLWISAFFYTIQLYADFSGYSDMAIGIAKLIGFSVTKNFDFPFFSQNIAEYWRKWHISLTSWLTDYVFSPLSIAFRDYGKLGIILAILINFAAIGLWHGPNWTYVVFGLLHGCYYIPLILRGTMNNRRKLPANKLPSLKELRNITGTFLLVMLTNIVFMANDISSAIGYFKQMLKPSVFASPALKEDANICIFSVFFLLIVEWLQRNKEHGLQITQIKNPLVRQMIYVTILILILILGVFENKVFIYFQF